MDNLTPEPPNGWPHSWCNVFWPDGKLKEVMHVNDLWEAMLYVLPQDESLGVIVFKRTAPNSFVYQGSFRESYEWVNDFILRVTGNDMDAIRWSLKKDTPMAKTEGLTEQDVPFMGAGIFGIHFWDQAWENWAQTNKEQDKKNAARAN